MYVRIGTTLTPLTRLDAEAGDGVQTWGTDALCSCGSPLIGLLLTPGASSSIALSEHAVTCQACGQQYPIMKPEGHMGAMIPSGENEVREIHMRLTELEAERKILQDRLNQIMRVHIENKKVRIEDPDGCTGDAGLFSTYTKARLMQIIEEHWSMHHMGAVPYFEGWRKEQMVEYVLNIKGVGGHYAKPATKASQRRAPTKRQKVGYV